MNNPHQLGRLSAVDLREIFTSEASHFTPWLAREENLALLSETIGISLQCDGTEKEVGPYRADILCKDADTDHWVLIENQIEKTDHIHLGQLLTYAAGLEAVTIVWVAQRFTDEHRAALDWLNEHTDENINFFGLEIELWKIGNSPVAPKFNVVSQPNDWSRNVRAAARTSEITPHKQLQQRFWLAFREYMEKNSHVPCQKASPQHWMVHPIGRAGFQLTSIASKWNTIANTELPEIRVEMAIVSRDAKRYFALLEKHRPKIDQQLGAGVTWYNPPEKVQARLFIRKDADFLNESLWPEQHKWLKDNLELLKNVLGPIVQKLELPQMAKSASAI